MWLATITSRYGAHTYSIAAYYSQISVFSSCFQVWTGYSYINSLVAVNIVCFSNLQAHYLSAHGS